jgi:hypothetical protein
MHRSSPFRIDVLSDLDEHIVTELITALRQFSDALEQHYAAALVDQQQRDWESRQSSLWPDDDPPF